MTGEIQIGISIAGILMMIVIAYGGRRNWEGKMEAKLCNMQKNFDNEFESTKQLCVKHQEHIEHIDVSDARQDQQLKEHERRIFTIESEDK